MKAQGACCSASKLESLGAAIRQKTAAVCLFRLNVATTYAQLLTQAISAESVPKKPFPLGSATDWIHR